MRFAIVSEHEDVPALARRLYRPGSAEALRDAERALLEANPHLADAESRVAGAVVVVPEVAGATATEDAQREGQLLAPLLQAARDRLPEVGEALRATLESRRATVKATVDQIGSAEVRQLLREEPTLKEVVADVSRDAKAETTEIDEIDAVQRQAIVELGGDLDELLRAVGGQPRTPPTDIRTGGARPRPRTAARPRRSRREPPG